MPVPAPSSAADLIGRLPVGANVVVPLANGEPVGLLDALESAAAEAGIDGVRVHQMHALHDRGYLDGRYGTRLRHVSYFLSPVTRPHFRRGTVDLVPAHFSEVPQVLRALPDVVVVAACSEADQHIRTLRRSEWSS